MMAKTEQDIMEIHFNNRLAYFEQPLVQPILTIIVPAYNVDKYLKCCIYSLLDNKYANKIEILIIDDGSGDRTSEIADEFERLTTINGQSIVKVIHKENGGHGSTINIGIQLSIGKYIKIVDGDDWVDNKNFELLIERMEDENSDLILCNYSEDDCRSLELVPKRYYNTLEDGKVYSFKELCNSRNMFSQWGPILATSTYKTEVLRKAHISLPEKTYYVDMLFNAKAIEFVNTVKYYDIDVYRYYHGNFGQSISSNSRRKNYKQHEKVVFEILNYCYSNEISSWKKDYIIRKIAIPMIKSHYIITIEVCRTRDSFLSFEKKLKKYEEIYNLRECIDKPTKFHRITYGYLVKYNHPIRKVFRLLKKLIGYS